METEAKIRNFLSMMKKQEAGALRQDFDFEKLYWKVHYKVNNAPEYIMYIEYNDLYLYVQTDIELPRVAKKCFLPLYFYLLNLNEHLSMVKFGILKTTIITLMAEVPLEDIKYSVFERTIKMVANVLEQYRPEIYLISTDEKLAELIMPKLPSCDLALIKMLDTQ